MAILFGLPLGAFALSAGVFGVIVLYGLAVGLVQGRATAGEIRELLSVIAIFGIILLAFLGVALRLAWPSASLARHPARERGLFRLLTLALVGLGLLTLIQPNPLMLSGLALVGLCWLGTLGLKPPGSTIPTGL